MRVVTALVAVSIGVFGTFAVLSVAPGTWSPWIVVPLSVSAGALLAGLLAPFAATWVGLAVGLLSLIVATIVLLGIRQEADIAEPIMTTQELLRSALSIAAAVVMANLGRILRQFPTTPNKC